MGAPMPGCEALATPGGLAALACAMITAILLAAIALGFLALRRRRTPELAWTGWRLAAADPGLRVIWQLALWPKPGGAAPRAHIEGGRR